MQFSLIFFLRQFSGDKEKEKEFSSVLTFRIIFGILALISITIGSFFITHDISVRKLIFILAFYIQIDSLSDFLSLFFQARQRMEYQSFSKITKSILLVGFAFFLIFIDPSIQNLGYGYLLSSILAMILILFFFHKKIYPISISLNKKIWQRYFSLLWPVALAGFFLSLTAQMDAVIMGRMNMISQIGYYSAALKILAGVFIPLALLNIVFYPAINKAFIEGKEKFQKIWDFQISLMVSLLLPLLVGCIVLAPKIINFIYGGSYSASILVFQILLFSGIIVFINKLFSQVLYILNRQNMFLWINLVGAVVNIGLNLFLIPRFGIYGAAVVNLITFSVIFVITIAILRKFISISFFDSKFFVTSAISGLACIVMYFAISVPKVYDLHVVFSVFIGMVIYSTIFFISKFFLKNIGLVKEIF